MLKHLSLREFSVTRRITPVGGSNDHQKSGVFQSLFQRKNVEPNATEEHIREFDTGLTALLVDPDRVRVWPSNGRDYHSLTADNCRDLIDSIELEGKQHVPAIARPVDDDEAYDFEVIAGTRRHFAVSWLKHNRMPRLRLLISVESIDDEQAFHIADVENRSRRDISDIERARSYALALTNHYGGHLSQMAERLSVSKGWLSKMVRVAEIPDEIVSAFASPSDIRMKPAYLLCVAIESPAARLSAVRVARQIERAQVARREEGAAAYPPAEILRSLMDAAKQQEPSSKEYLFSGPTGLPALSVIANGKSGITIKIHGDGGASREQLTEAFEEAIATAKHLALSLD